MPTETTQDTANTTEALIREVEKTFPGFRAMVEAEQAALHAKYPDPEERRKFVLYHFINAKDVISS